MSPILGIFASQGKVSSTAYESIATYNLGSAQSSVTFSSIPSTYKHLQIRGIMKVSGAGTNFGIRFNSDTGSNYSWHQLYGSGSSAGAGGYPNSSFIGNSFVGSTQFTGFVVDILNYESTNINKTVRTLGGADENGGGNIVLSSGSWRNTAAVNTIYLYDPYGGANFTQYSSFALYGIKG